jgi:hypothetical protein
LPGGTEKNHEHPQPGKPVSGQRFEPGTFRIGRSVNHSTTTFGVAAAVIIVVDLGGDDEYSD